MRAANANEVKLLRLFAGDTAGARGRLVARALEGHTYVHIWEGKQPSLHFNDETLRIDHLELPGEYCPFVWVHEFGHAYHCYFWPERSAVMPEANGEAVGFLFEYELAALAKHRNREVLLKAWPARERDLRAVRKTQAKAFDILEQMLQTRDTDFHALVGRIVACDCP